MTVLSTLRRILSIGKIASAACVSDFEESTMSNKSSSCERRFRYSFNRYWEKLNFSALPTTCYRLLLSQKCVQSLSLPWYSVTRDQVFGFSAAAIGLGEEYEEDEKAAREGRCEFFFGSPGTWLSTAIKPLENGITRW